MVDLGQLTEKGHSMFLELIGKAVVHALVKAVKTDTAKRVATIALDDVADAIVDQVPEQFHSEAALVAKSVVDRLNAKIGAGGSE